METIGGILRQMNAPLPLTCKALRAQGKSVPIGYRSRATRDHGSLYLVEEGEIESSTPTPRSAICPSRSPDTVHGEISLLNAAPGRWDARRSRNTGDRGCRVQQC